ncbi:LOW QUALITY PROTEIN: armadillo repeat protein deleted in velo-cardio-facial syndrome-like [Hypomesus transpacificus]|uniref:LOW QUALITY PROTEIN: armadillo repeat protein deleted in velo-cardio-facial syndrome-like n=1 Tax=Hypomesus transpacificus TaxID=137520 RepID=UPI001F07C9B1|nr:LOW QUALITY PROTEIN: armadillo repeat protein deleted in velo-cardio-facial syndrome-like [Hypomesus transpacificus]
MPAEVKQEQSPSNQTSLAMMQEPQEVVEETVTIEEDPGTPTSHVSVVTSDDGTTRRTETKVTKMVKTVTTRTVRQVPLGPDGLPLPEGSSPLGSYTDSIDRRYAKNGGERYITPQATSTLTRSYNNYNDSYSEAEYGRHYGLHDGYGDATENYGSLSRGVNFRPPRYPYLPNSYRPENSYTLPIRKDDYGHVAQPQVPMGTSSVELNRSQPERFQAEPYGLEDDRRSLGPEEEEPYELEPDYSTANRRTLGANRGRTLREPLRDGPRGRCRSLRNVSSDGAEARRRLRECEGLVDALLHALQSAVGKKDMDNKSVENCVCIMRNLSYHVHKEVPGADKFQDPSAPQAPGSAGPQRKKKDDAGCFGGKKAKEEWFNQGRKNGENDKNYDTLDLPKRTEPTKGFELLYQPEVVRLYLSLLTESQNYNTLEAAAGALQNLSAGQWTWSNYIRATVRKEKGLPILVELLRSDSDKVVRAVAIALRNLSIDRRNKDLIGSYAMRDLVSNLPSGQQRPAKNLEEDTVVAILNTIHEIVTDSSENARSLIQAQAIEKLVAINRTSQSPRETKAASHVLQTVWSYKDLRNALTKDGWNKSHFQPTAAAVPKAAKNGKPGYDDTTLPLMEKNQGTQKCGSGDVVPMDELGPDGYSTIDQRDKDCKYKPVDGSVDLTEREPLKNDTNRTHYIRSNRPTVSLVDDVKPQPVDSWV